jgi:hypothetical protein
VRLRALSFGSDLSNLHTLEIRTAGLVTYLSYRTSNQYDLRVDPPGSLVWRDWSFAIHVCQDTLLHVVNCLASFSNCRSSLDSRFPFALVIESTINQAHRCPSYRAAVSSNRWMARREWWISDLYLADTKSSSHLFRTSLDLVFGSRRMAKLVVG